MLDFFFAVHIVFTGIVLQALPFMVLGGLLSSILHVFVPNTIIIKVFPKKYGIGFLTALFSGLFFPVCECASVPMMRGLIKKGVAMPIAVTFMLASPIINPVSIISTFYAFPQQPSIALYRVYFGLLIAFGIGLLLLLYPEEAYLKDDFCVQYGDPVRFSQRGMPGVFNPAKKRRLLYELSFSPSSHRSGEQQSIQETMSGTSYRANKIKTNIWRSVSAKISAVLLHTGEEFFAAGPFLIFGAFITAVIRIAVPQSFFGIDTSTAVGSLLLMMLFAFVFSACSSSDAFIARSFVNRFPTGSILGFLVYGPMMDIKNLFMLLSLFKKRFVLELTIIITAVNAIGLAFLIKLFL